MSVHENFVFDLVKPSAFCWLKDATRLFAYDEPSFDEVASHAPGTIFVETRDHRLDRCLFVLEAGVVLRYDIFLTPR